MTILYCSIISFNDLYSCGVSGLVETWVGLSNSDRVLCFGDGCEGLLYWYDDNSTANDLSAPFMPYFEVDQYLVCTRMGSINGTAAVRDFFCAGEFYVLCEKRCEGLQDCLLI